MDDIQQHPKIVVRRIPQWMRVAIFVGDLVTGALDWSTMARVEMTSPDGSSRALSRWMPEPYARRLASKYRTRMIDD